jgi:hypothetical protein
VVSALQPLFILAAAAILVIFIVRAIPSVTLAQAAGAADAKANLHDELKTAYWLATRSRHSPLESLQMRRARATAQRLDGRALIAPLSRGRIGAALVLALTGGIFMQFAPGSFADDPARSLGIAGAGSGAARRIARNAESTDRLAGQTRGARGSSTGVDTEQAERAQNGDRADDRPKPPALELKEAAAFELPTREREAVQPAPKASDLQHPSAAANQNAARTGAAAQTPGNASSDKATGESTMNSVFDKLSESTRRFADGGGQNAVTGDAEAKDKADDDSDAPVQQNITKEGGQTGDGKAVPMAGQPQGEGLQGKGQGLPTQGSEDSEGGGQRPEFATLTTTGGSGSPKGDPTADLKGLNLDAAKGKPTKRIQAPSRFVSIEGQTGASARSTDEFFAATRWQPSQLDYRALTPKAHHAPEAAIDGEQVPLAHRSTVRDYFLTFQQQSK